MRWGRKIVSFLFLFLLARNGISSAVDFAFGAMKNAILALVFDFFLQFSCTILLFLVPWLLWESAILQRKKK